MQQERLVRIMMTRVLGLVALSILWVGAPCLADENSVRAYLANGESTAYLQIGDFRIERIDPRPHEPEGALVFRKFITDLPLHGSRVVVIEDADESVARVFDDSAEHLDFQFVPPAVPPDRAVAMVEAATANAVGSDAVLVWFRTGDEAVLAWEVTTSLADTGRPVSPTHLETVVDASTGAVLSQRQIDTKVYAAGTPETAAGVFPRIVINNTIGAAGSKAYAAPFDAVVEVAFGCTGTLIADNVVLCARHCGVGAGDTIIFGDDANGGGDFSATVLSSFLPDGGGSLLDGGDVSILTLTSSIPVAIAEPMRLLDATDDLVGMQCATLGYGYNGLGSVGHGFTADGFRWGGENTIDVYGSPASSSGANIISTDFDNGTGGANTIGSSSPTPVPYEATTAPGDSGGPVLVQVDGEWVIAGVLSGGTTSTSVYGDISWWTGTAVYRTAIESSGGEFVGVPCPGDFTGSGAVPDGNVDIVDLLGLLAAWGPNPGHPADINGDGTVGVVDLLALLEKWGPCTDPPPANDDCADFISIESVATGGCFEYDTSLATTDGPVNPSGVCNDFSQPHTEHDIWFSYTATSTGTMTVTTCDDVHGGAEAGYDTDLVVYGPYGSTGAIACDHPSLSANFNACNDDDPVNPCGTGVPFSSTISISVTAGDVYLIRAGGWQEGHSGVATLCIIE